AASVVDPHVEPAELGDGGLADGVDVVAIGDVGRDDHGAWRTGGFRVRGHLSQLGFTTRGEDEAVLRRAQPPRQSGTDAAARAGDDGRFLSHAYLLYGLGARRYNASHGARV